MFKTDDEKYILRQLSNNQVVLFLGSGFSLKAKNKLGENFPTGYGLGKKIWEFLEYTEDYDNTVLPEMYQAFLGKGISLEKKKEFLINNLTSSEIPADYNNLPVPYWFKIYTTNIDDIIEKTYRNERKKIVELIFPFDQYSERDQSLESTQVIYLHGKLPCNPDEVIFSPQQYAKAQLTHEPLYAQFVYDYSTLPTIFIGTELNEPLFERYIAARNARFGLKERRPKSFLITPNLSPVKADNLKTNYNVHHIPGTTVDFLEWLSQIRTHLPSKVDIIRNTFPNLLDLMEFSKISFTSKSSLNEFAKCFKRVPKEIEPVQERSGFLMGTSPRWNDIARDLDIPRTINETLFNHCNTYLSSTNKNDKTMVIGLIGHAGSGKSTIIKRLGLTLSQNARTTFLSYSDFIPRISDITNVLTSIDQRVVLLFDNSKNALPQIPKLINALNRDLKYPPLIVLSIRSNFSNYLERAVTPDLAELIRIRIPNLDNQEINDLISKLEENNLLGVLSGMSSGQRFSEFKKRANRQLLVAMKEATQGKLFDQIIRDEYDSLTPHEAKIIALCIALNSELGFTNSKQDIVGFAKVAQNEALNFLDTVLDGTIISVGTTKSRFMLRHKILADYIIDKCASQSELKEAYIRVLSVLAPELIQTAGPSRIFNLYKALINHRLLYRRFKNDIELAREVYESITAYFKSDFHFWLQYGSLEMEGEGGDLLLSQNYISQAESLNPKSNFVQTAKCQLLYRQSISAATLDQSIEYKNAADQLAQSLLLSYGEEEPILFHINIQGRYRYISKWIHDRDEKIQEFIDLKSTVETGLSFHPFNRELSTLGSLVDRARIQLGLNADLDDPAIPDFLDNR
ncbi:SIR2 family protein [bacterium]|nr:MAG: SIR2 family protein [bacterium]